MRLLISSFLLFLSLNYGASLECSKEVFGITLPMSCPGPGDPADARYCCGWGDNKYCCSEILQLDDEDLDKILDSLPKIIGILAGVVVAMIVLCIVCCCCCPFCLLAKRRNAGAVHTPARPAEASAMQPLQQQPPPQMGYPAQPMYPQQPYPAQGYPPQPYPAQGPPMGPPHPLPQQPYPQPPPGDQPPAYSAEKQPAFNPNYSQP